MHVALPWKGCLESQAQGGVITVSGSKLLLVLCVLGTEVWVLCPGLGASILLRYETSGLHRA